MGSANSKDKAEHQTRHERALAAIEAYSIKLEKRSGAEPMPPRKGQRLDVDGVLSRSLKEVSQ